MRPMHSQQDWRWLAGLSIQVVALPLAAFGQAAALSVDTFERLAREAYAKFKDHKGGKNADYIPALAKVPSSST